MLKAEVTRTLHLMPVTNRANVLGTVALINKDNHNTYYLRYTTCSREFLKVLLIDMYNLRRKVKYFRL
jgi:hypothetical protein